MPTTTYADYIGTAVAGSNPANTSGGLIRDWANRDNNVLSQQVVERCLEWGADECYRRLRVPALEVTRTYTVQIGDISDDLTYRFGNIVTFDVPSDFIELIYLYRPRDYTMFNHRVDNRTILDSYADIQYNSFTRKGNQFELYGLFEAGDQIEVHYYRRLPALDGRYSVGIDEFNAFGNNETVSTFFDVRSSAATNYTSLRFVPPTGVSKTITNSNLAFTDTAVSSGGVELFLRGNEASHWLRDENQRVLMFGALMEVFNYLDEPESYVKYQQRFMAEIEELNAQERRRDAMGGNIQVSYTSGII